MDVSRRIEEVKARALHDAQRHARSGDAEAVTALGRTLEKVGLLERRLLALVAEVETLERGDVVDAEPTLQPDAVPLREVSEAKERGRQARSEFLKLLKTRGVTLRPERGDVIFRTASGVRISISYARERQAGRWFIGLSSEPCQAAILLCESGGATKPLELGSAFLAKYGTRFSHSNGQYKINVVRRGDGEFFVKVPGVGAVPVHELVDVDWLQ